MVLDQSQTEWVCIEPECQFTEPVRRRLSRLLP